MARNWFLFLHLHFANKIIFGTTLLFKALKVYATLLKNFSTFFIHIYTKKLEKELKPCLLYSIVDGESRSRIGILYRSRMKMMRLLNTLTCEVDYRQM
jgi:hypothetical protein